MSSVAVGAEQLPPEPKPKCERCLDTGWVAASYHSWGAVKSNRACDCRERRVMRTVAKKIAAEVPENWRQFNSLDRLEPYVTADALVELDGYASHFVAHMVSEDTPPRRSLERPNGLWLVGESGSAKTMAAAALVQEIAARLRAADRDRWLYRWSPSWRAWWSFGALLDELRAGYADDADESTLRLQHGLRDVDLLVLDDLAAARVNGWVTERAYLIVNGRYDAGRPLIVTTDIDKEQLVKLFSVDGDRRQGWRTIRRIEDNSVTIEFPERLNLSPTKSTFADLSGRRRRSPGRRPRGDTPYGELPE